MVARRFSRPTRSLVAGSVVMLAVGLLGACSRRSDSASDTAAAVMEAAATEAASEPAFGAPEASSAPGTSAPGTSAPGANASGNAAKAGNAASAGNGPDGGSSLPIEAFGNYTPITSAQIKRSEITLSIPTAKFNASVAQLTSLPGSVGGFITSSNFEGGTESSDTNRVPRSGVVVMRVPSNQFDTVRRRLPSFGKTLSEQISGEEVSAQLVDLEARLTSLRLQEESYRKLFNAATQIQDIITVQERITEVRTRIEQIAAQRAALQDQVAMSTITVNVRERMTIEEKVVAPKDADEGFAEKTKSAWRSGTNGLVSVLTALAVTLAVLAPFSPFLAAAAVLVWWLVRRNRRSATPLPTTVPVSGAGVTVPADSTVHPTEHEDSLV
jgi:hypothetical protein